MSFVSTQPEALTAAASTLQGIGSSISAPNAAAAAQVTGVVPAAGGEVSVVTAAQFATRRCIRLRARAAAMFVNTAGTGAGSHAATEVVRPIVAC
ncbi:MAG TPA: PE family protein [Mycobacterium sp.]|nr:PE family protein [Mycobacterium sp.]HTX93560.1 PE family protein [Mycobacterium sp.]